MTTKGLLLELENRGAEISLKGDKVKIVFDPGSIPPDLLEAARKAKAEIKAILTAKEETARGFNPKQAYNAIGETLDALNAAYPAGALEWSRNHRPDLTAEANAALREVDAAFLDKEAGQLSSALARYQVAVYAIFTTYQGRK